MNLFARPRAARSIADRARRIAAMLGLAVALLAPSAYLGIIVGAMALSLGVHLAVALAALALLSFVKRSKAAGATALLGAAIAVAPWLLVAPPAATTSPVARPCARVFAINAFERNLEDTSKIVESIAAVGADVVLLIEPRPGLVDAMAETSTVVLRHDAGGKFDLAAIVKDRELVSSTALHRFENTKSVVGELVLACEEPVSLFFVHIPAPTIPRQQAARWHMKDALATIVAARPRAVVSGDFNAVPPSPVLVDLARGAALERVVRGATWPIYVGPLGLPIDHVFARGVAIDAERRTIAGSDHAGFVFEVSPRRRGS